MDQVAFKAGDVVLVFQVREAREVRDFTLTLLPTCQDKLNYPEGCMTPTGIQPTPDFKELGAGVSPRHALSNKGMGVALPQLPQPAQRNAVLEIERVGAALRDVGCRSRWLRSAHRANNGIVRRGDGL
jgi:hypothetical protein